MLVVCVIRSLILRRFLSAKYAKGDENVFAENRIQIDQPRMDTEQIYHRGQRKQFRAFSCDSRAISYSHFRGQKTFLLSPLERSIQLPRRYNHRGDGGIVESVEIDPDNL